MHLDTVRASAAKLSRNPPFIQEKVVGYFFPGNDKPFRPPSRPPSASKQWNCSKPPPPRIDGHPILEGHPDYKATFERNALKNALGGYGDFSEKRVLFARPQ